MRLARWPLILGAGLVASSITSAVEFGSLIPEQSTLRFVFRQMNVPVEGRFRGFKADIALDTERPQSGHAAVEVALASVDTGSDEADTEAKGKGWFNAGAYPTARFVSDSVRPISPGRFEVAGKLTLKGRVQPVTVVLTLVPAGQNMILEGSFPLHRLQFGIGEGEWSDPSMVSDEVQVRVHFTLAPRGRR